MLDFNDAPRQTDITRLVRLCNPKTWPRQVRDRDYLLMDGEVFSPVPSGEEYEDRWCKPLFWHWQ